MERIPAKCICITCKTYEVNPVIGKSFCSRTCQELWSRSDMQWLSMEALQLIALKKHSELMNRDKFN